MYEYSVLAQLVKGPIKFECEIVNSSDINAQTSGEKHLSLIHI